MPGFLAFFCCAPGVGPREFLVIAVVAFVLVGIPLWAWYRKQKLANRDDGPPLPPLPPPQ